MTFIQGCCPADVSSQRIHVRLTDKIKLTDLTVIMGEEKTSWATIDEGNELSSTLCPTINGELSILYRQNGKAISSNGPLIDISKKNDILIQIGKKDIQYFVK